MSSARYAPLSRSAEDADRELDDAFAGDDDEDAHRESSAPVVPAAHVPGTYDFEREYDCPPPGSPPPPSALALPNDIGNSNGLLPTDAGIASRVPRLSFFRRAVGAVLPTHYTRLPASDASVRFGGGTENDGVFANVTAKPQRALTAVGPSGELYIVPEDSQKQPPPSYASAQAEAAAPPYGETTVHAPAGDMLIDDLPSGSIWLFLSNMVLSFFFPLIGFVISVLLHTTHAAKYGGRAGLGLTLIQYGIYQRAGLRIGGGGAENAGDAAGVTVTPSPIPRQSEEIVSPDLDDVPMITPSDWIGFVLMTTGIFVLLSSSLGFWRVKRWEASIRAAAPADAPLTQEDIERDAAVRREIASVFGIPVPEDRHRQPVHREMSSQELEDEARLASELRAVGLL